MKTYITEYSKYLNRPDGTTEGWVVRAGAKKKTGAFRYVGGVFDHEDKANAHRDYRKAVAYVREANKLIPKMDLDAAKDVGWEMNYGIDMVTDRLADEDPDHDERDGRGWLA